MEEGGCCYGEEIVTCHAEEHSMGIAVYMRVQPHAQRQAAQKNGRAAMSGTHTHAPHRSCCIQHVLLRARRKRKAGIRRSHVEGTAVAMPPVIPGSSRAVAAYKPSPSANRYRSTANMPATNRHNHAAWENSRRAGYVRIVNKNTGMKSASPEVGW